MVACDIQDYLYQLAESVRALAPASYDSHLFALEVSIRSSVWCYLPVSRRLWLTNDIIDTAHTIASQTRIRWLDGEQEEEAIRPGEDEQGG